MTTTVLAGGVGAARFLSGLVQVVEPETITAVVNTADDIVMHGLSISPDLDTVVYTVAGAIDRERGWGLEHETWRAMESLARYGEVRPPLSAAAATWFNLGDRDLGTHLYRTARLDEGATLTEVTAEIARAWGLTIGVVPMSDDAVRTFVTVAGSGESIAFQDYFVRHRHDISISDVEFRHDAASPSPAAMAALGTATAIVIAPSNPLVSIGPIRAMPGVDETLTARRDHVAAVSPIVGNAAIKGPADRMLAELGMEPSVVGVARLYAPVASVLVVDTVDAHLADDVERLGMRCVVHPSIMSTPAAAAALARATLAAIAG